MMKKTSKAMHLKLMNQKQLQYLKTNAILAHLQPILRP